MNPLYPPDTSHIIDIRKFLYYLLHSAVMSSSSITLETSALISSFQRLSQLINLGSGGANTSFSLRRPLSWAEALLGKRSHRTDPNFPSTYVTAPKHKFRRQKLLLTRGMLSTYRWCSVASAVNISRPIEIIAMTIKTESKTKRNQRPRGSETRKRDWMWQ